MKTTGAAPSHPDEWHPTSEDQKHYPHFDAPLRLSEIRALVNDSERVAQNAFFPLIQYEKKWQPFRTPKPKDGAKKPKPERKRRKIRYAARRDAYIFSRYRKILSPLYELKLKALQIDDVPLAYRKVPSEGGAGKCNIDFAKDVFDFISSKVNSFVITLDISQFFELLDHERIENLWRDLLQTDTLPNDHAAVFRALTRYHWVDRTEAYRRLGYFGKKLTPKGEMIEGYLRPWNEIPTQLCNPKEFHEKIAGGGAQDNIIKTNAVSHGIPQGTPISDLIANIYLMDFDTLIKGIALNNNGRAFRYSDDILLVIEAGGTTEAKEIEEEIRASVGLFGDKLLIKENKSSIHRFYRNNGDLTFEWIKGAGLNGLEYLGFRFDGKRVFLRDSTLANLRRKMTYSGRIRARRYKKRYSNRSPQELTDNFNYDHFFQTFMRVEQFDPSSSVKNWTFWTYVRRAVKTFGAISAPINKQLRFLKPDAKRLIEAELSA